MAKAKSVFTCSECGGQTPRWQGQCPSCDAWNTLVEGPAEQGGAVRPLRLDRRYVERTACARRDPTAGVAAHTQWHRGVRPRPRRRTGARWVVLIGGDPGIGKSTLLLQALSVLAAGLPALYVTGEESAEQVALRAQRLQLTPVTCRSFRRSVSNGFSRCSRNRNPGSR